MTIEDIFNTYTPGSQGFCIAVETHCGFDIARDEIERIGERAQTADEFYTIWNNEDWWADGNQ